MNDAYYRVWAVSMSVKLAHLMGGPVFVLAASVEDAIATAKRIVVERLSMEQQYRVESGLKMLTYDVEDVKCESFSAVIGDALRWAVRNA